MVDGAVTPAERALRYGGRRSEARGAGATPMVDGAVTPTGTPAAPLLLSGGLVGGRRQDIAIRDGRIERAGAGLDASGYQRLDVKIGRASCRERVRSPVGGGSTER